MAVYALGDLHLAHAVDKPMGIFGEDWEDHHIRMRAAWIETVAEDDIVLIPGDISWAMTLDEAKPDLAYIADLPGRKIMIRGNHDYWWNGISKVRNSLPEGVHAIQNDAMSVSGVTFCGTRGWLLPTHPKFTADDESIYLREIGRLKMSLEQAVKLGSPIVAMLHYPPSSNQEEESAFTETMSQYGVQMCVYGHLHGTAHKFAYEGTHGGVEYRLVSADYVGFRPVRLLV